MKKHQAGFGIVQVALALAAVVALSIIAVPKYEEYLIRTKMSEAFNLATDTKSKLSEFYMVKNRFPNSLAEAQAVTGQAFSTPEFVRQVVVNHENEAHAVVVEVYFNEGAIPGGIFNEDFLYVAGDVNAGPGAAVRWSCGAEGIAPRFLPESCRP